MIFKRKAQILAAIVCFALAFAITLQYKSVTRNSGLGTAQIKRTEQIEAELVNANQEIINLKKENMQLASDIELYRQEAASNDTGSKALKKELEKMSLLSGLEKVSGPGVVITISDSTEENDKAAGMESGIVHDSDLRSVANELFGAGAEVVSINGERLISNSSIRCVGSTIMVNSKRCSSPFTVKAIGDKDVLESAISMPGGILDVLKIYKIKVNVTKESNIVIDKFNGSTEYTYAKKYEK